MKWEGYWCGAALFAENEDDNKSLDEMLGKLDKEPRETYDYGKLEVETIEGLRVVTFNRRPVDVRTLPSSRLPVGGVDVNL